MTLPPWLESPNPDIFLGDNFLVLDFETTNLEKGNPSNPDNHLILACWYYEGKMKYKWGDEFDMAELAEDIAKADFIVAHNTKFELGWLKRCNLELSDLLAYCTLLGEKVEAGNRHWLLSLEESCLRHNLPGKIGLVSKLISNGVCPSRIPRSILLEYCMQDVWVDYLLFLDQRKSLKDKGLLPTQFTRCIMTPVLADIEFIGVHLDKELVIEEYERVLKQKHELDKEVSAFCGDINLNSPPQVATFLYETLGFKELTNRRGRPDRNKPTKQFPDGIPKTDGDTIDKLVPRNNKQRYFLELKKRQAELDAALDKTLAKFYQCVTETEDHVLHFQYNQHITKTHRLSSNGRKFKVQGQNMANLYKRLISARNPSHGVFECDYGKLEFNVAAFLGQDPQAIEDVTTGFDVHRYSAAVMKHGQMEGAEDIMGDINSEERRLAKPDTFGPLYGKTKGTPQQMAYFEAFKQKYHVLDSVQEGWINDVLGSEDKSLTTCTGFKYYFPYVKISKSGYVEENTKIRNYPIQGLATAEIVPTGVTYFWHLLKRSKLTSFLTNTVHDSLICEGPEDERQQLEELCHEALITRVYKYLRTVYNVDYNLPLEIECKFGTHWGK